MKYYKHTNKRIVQRGANGRFQKSTLKNTFGITANTERLICGACGYGKKDHFFPLIDTGFCPKCDKQEGHIPLREYLDSLVGFEFWYIADFWEEFHAVLVTVMAVSSARKISLVFEIEPGELHEYEITDSTEFYADKAEAEREAAHRNALTIAGRGEYA